MKNELDTLKEIASEVKKQGGEVYFIGGYVRDALLKKVNKDIDVEVYGLSIEELKQILSQFGRVDEIGRSFGILMIHGLDIDFALPRKEIQGKIVGDIIKIPYCYDEDKIKSIRIVYPHHKIVVDSKEKFGHRDFIVIPDPFISVKEASMRRDFTINSLLMNVLTKEIIDPWGGIKDIEEGIIRHINDHTFIQDPLRVLRACQFSARFNFNIAKETIELCKQIDLSTLPKERIFQEVEKALLKGKKPSIAFKMMNEMGVLDKLFPELKAMIGCPQSPEYHPEGDVWNHTMMVLDYASKIKDKSKNPIAFMLSALLHDVGKPSVTTEMNGRITSAKHEIVGEEIARSFLQRITTEKKLIEAVCSLVKNHMRPHFLYPDGTDKAIRRLAVDVDIDEILLIAEADSVGKRNNGEDFEVIRKWFKEKLTELNADKKITPLVTGKDLIKLGMKPGKHFKVILDKAFDMQLEGQSKDNILNYIVKQF